MNLARSTPISFLDFKKGGERIKRTHKGGKRAEKMGRGEGLPQLARVSQVSAPSGRLRRRAPSAGVAETLRRACVRAPSSMGIL